MSFAEYVLLIGLMNCLTILLLSMNESKYIMLAGCYSVSDTERGDRIRGNKLNERLEPPGKQDENK